MATVGKDGVARLWSPQTHELLHELHGHADPKIWAIAFSPDGKTLATGGEDKRLVLWDADAGKQAGAITFPGLIRACAFAPHEQQLAVAVYGSDTSAASGSVRVVDLKTMQPTQSLPAAWHCLTFSPDGTILAKSNGNAVELWDTQKWQKRHILRGHMEQVWQLTFSPDGRTLATASWDRTVKLWHVASAELMLTFKMKAGVVWGVAFSPDGRALVASSGSPYREVRIWHAPPTEEVTREEPVDDREAEKLLQKT